MIISVQFCHFRTSVTLSVTYTVRFKKCSLTSIFLFKLSFRYVKFNPSPLSSHPLAPQKPIIAFLILNTIKKIFKMGWQIKEKFTKMYSNESACCKMSPLFTNQFWKTFYCVDFKRGITRGTSLFEFLMLLLAHGGWEVGGWKITSLNDNINIKIDVFEHSLLYFLDKDYFHIFHVRPIIEKLSLLIAPLQGQPSWVKLLQDLPLPTYTLSNTQGLSKAYDVKY